MKNAGRLAILCCMLTVAAVSGLSQVRNTRAILGFNMRPFTAADGSFSFLYPVGWTVTVNQNGASVSEKTGSTASPQIDLVVMNTGGQMTSSALIALLCNQMVANYPSFAKLAQKQLSVNPDVSAVLFTYMEGSVLMSGFGIAAASGQAVLWADIFGPDARFRNFNAAQLLTYVMSSLSPGTTPRSPALPTAARKAPAPSAKPQPGSANYRRRLNQAAAMTHYWNNFRLIHPGGVLWSR